MIIMSLNTTFKGFQVKKGLCFFCMSTVGRIGTNEWELESGRDQINMELSSHIVGMACFDKEKMLWHSKYVVMDQGCRVEERGESNHIKSISSIGRTIELDYIMFESTLVWGT